MRDVSLDWVKDNDLLGARRFLQQLLDFGIVDRLHFILIVEVAHRCLLVRQLEALPGEKNAREYGKAVHNDYTGKSGPRRVRDHLPPAEAVERLQHRFAEINVWRPIRGPIESTPLAVCDSSLMDPKDFVPSDLIYRDKVGENYRFTYNPNHRWFYFPRLERNEVILLKCYDSKEDGRARFTAHSAFEDPTSAPDVAPRESIEVRALVFWPAEKGA